MTHPADGQLSPEAIDDLSTDHLVSDPPDQNPLPISFGQEDPASEATPLGRAVLDVATGFLKMPLREDAGVNRDKNGYIRSFFLEGLKWSADTWDHWLEKHPQSGVEKPEWCAAFAGFCTRKAYGSAGLSLPVALSGSASDLATRTGSANRLLTREALFHDDGSLREGVTPPGPGDLVIWHGHVGVLLDIFPSGAFRTIEGNTWRGKVRNDGVYQCERSSGEKRGDGTFKLVGFCLFASVDGRAKGQAQQAPAAQHPAAQQTPAQQQAQVAQQAPTTAGTEQQGAAAPAMSSEQMTDPEFEPPPAPCT